MGLIVHRIALRFSSNIRFWVTYYQQKAHQMRRFRKITISLYRSMRQEYVQKQSEPVLANRSKLSRRWSLSRERARDEILSFSKYYWVLWRIAKKLHVTRNKREMFVTTELPVFCTTARLPALGSMCSDLRRTKPKRLTSNAPSQWNVSLRASPAACFGLKNTLWNYTYIRQVIDFFNMIQMIHGR